VIVTTTPPAAGPVAVGERVTLGWRARSPESYEHHPRELMFIGLRSRDQPAHCGERVVAARRVPAPDAAGLCPPERLAGHLTSKIGYATVLVYTTGGARLPKE
jgi:hypothetical protein